jgi:SAM-dependent methyltransferase
MVAMLQSSQLAVAVLRNQFHRLRGGASRGGHRWAEAPPAEAQRHAKEIFDLLSPHVGPLADRTGLEIGPGDHLGLCHAFLAAGAARMYAAEKHLALTVKQRDPAELHEFTEGDSRLIVVRAMIEDLELPEPVDFIVSNDVLEHVRDVPASFRKAAALLRPGGIFASSVDLRGHNVYNRPDRPLDFLSCPDWLWRLMFSHLETSNRIRAHQLAAAAQAAGLEVVTFVPLATADPSYVASLKKDLLPRFQTLDDEDLRVLQVLIVGRKPMHAPGV